jgi:hypothetical protein
LEEVLELRCANFGSGAIFRIATFAGQCMSDNWDSIDMSAEMEIEKKKVGSSPEVVLDDFLTSVPPSVRYVVPGAWKPSSPSEAHIYWPEIKLYCDSPECEREMMFDEQDSEHLFARSTVWKSVFVRYRCRHCKKTGKLFALHMVVIEDRYSLAVFKIGEWPPFGPVTPSRVISLLGSAKEHFLKGRKAESLGLGIGAFAYYRRAIEEQKALIIGEIVKTARKVQSPPELIAQLEEAGRESSFSRSVEKIKDGIPEVLRIDGHNPLTLLHSALSEGLHSDSDAECLELATTIRIVLMDFCDRVGRALADQKELSSSISKLLNRNQRKVPPSESKGGA